MCATQGNSKRMQVSCCLVWSLRLRVGHYKIRWAGLDEPLAWYSRALLMSWQLAPRRLCFSILRQPFLLRAFGVQNIFPRSWVGGREPLAGNLEWRNGDWRMLLLCFKYCLIKNNLKVILGLSMFTICAKLPRNFSRLLCPTLSLCVEKCYNSFEGEWMKIEFRPTALFVTPADSCKDSNFTPTSFREETKTITQNDLY